MSRKPYHRLTAQDRMAVRYMWFVFSPPIPISVIAKAFDITENAINKMTYRCGFSKAPDMYRGNAPGRWRDVLLALYTKERQPDDEPNPLFAYFRAAKRVNAFVMAHTKKGMAYEAA